jgi:hypothetical protein
MAATNARRLAAFLLIAVFANGTLSCAQGISSATTALLEQMTRSAGVIFAGEVISVRRPDGYAGSGQDAAEGVVTVEFRVDDAVRGCVGSSVYTLREWAGLWTGGERYRVGQRLLMFLHTPNARGLSSPVHGAEGAIPVRGGGVAPGPYDGSALAAGWVVDLRWVQAQAIQGMVVTRTQSPGAESEEAERAQTNKGVAAREPTASALVPREVPVHWTAVAPRGERSMQPLAQVLTLCRGWVRASDGAL